jgi:lipid-A-disaccharide synthase
VSKRLFFVAGEASGDAHGAALMIALRAVDPALQFSGRGGPRMREAAGGEFVDWSEHSAVLGLWEVLKQYGYFRREFARTIKQIETQRPDAVVLIDYPGFNLRLARALRRKTPQLKIIYYISPQVWAWNRRRIPQMARYLDLMLCIFPFEAELYNQSGLRTVFVGHPMIDSLAEHAVSETRDPHLIGLFPGSRARELRKILPAMLGAAQRIVAVDREARFEIAAATSGLAALAEALVRNVGVADAVKITTGAARELMGRAHVGMVASGTATLEAALHRLPFVLVYRVAWLTYLAAKMLVRLEHIGMPNVLAGREIVREFVQAEARPAAIAEEVLRLSRDAARREQMLAEFEVVAAKLGRGGASAQAARAIVAAIS